MPSLTVNRARLHYEVRGSGTETIVFAHGLLMSGRMFDAQTRALADRCRTIAFDFRGQGESEETAAGYDMDSLARDAAALIQALGAAPCHFVGLSMGGFVGLRLAAREPELLRTLTLIGSSAEPEPADNVPRYRRLALVSRWFGMAPILFGRSFLADPAREPERRHWQQHLRQLRRRGTYRAARGAIERAGVEAELRRIRVPTLLIVGDEDVATPPARSERMLRALPTSSLVVVPRAGHSATLEQPEAVTTALRRFLDRQAQPSLTG